MTIIERVVDDRPKFDRLAKDFESEIAALFSELDTSGKGKLGQEELCILISHYGTPHGHTPFSEEALKKFYATYGQSDGGIEVREFRWYVADWACSFASDESKAAEWMPEVVSEIRGVLKNAKEDRRKNVLKELFALMDDDGDGFVTLEACQRVIDAGKVDASAWTCSWIATQPPSEEDGGKLSARAWQKLMLAAGEAEPEASWTAAVDSYKAAWSSLEPAAAPNTVTEEATVTDEMPAEAAAAKPTVEVAAEPTTEPTAEPTSEAAAEPGSEPAP